MFLSNVSSMPLPLCSSFVRTYRQYER
jgi:hypothetical protein